MNLRLTLTGALGQDPDGAMIENRLIIAKTAVDQPTARPIHRFFVVNGDIAAAEQETNEFSSALADADIHQLMLKSRQMGDGNLHATCCELTGIVGQLSLESLGDVSR